MPLLSVIVPAYNAGLFLEECALSILESGLPDLELIIVNDGSADDTASICDRLAEKDGRVKVLHRSNGGVSAARNAGIEAACGEYIAFADADDRLAPGAYERMLAALGKSGATCVACGYYLIMPDGSCKPKRAPLSPGFHDYAGIVEKLVIPLFADRVSRGLILGTVWRYLFRRSVIINNNIRFAGAYLEDEVFLTEYFSYPSTIYSLDEPLYHYRQNPSSVTRKYMPGCADVFCASLAKKENAAARFGPSLPSYWRHNTAWAGLLIVISNEFAPGNTKSFREKLKTLRAVCEMKDFKHAIKNYAPSGLAGSKAVVAGLVRRGLLLPLAVLYSLKNIGKG
ncbi:MAG: glycosyltransferase [Oscillospiraceae bacterium]|nr:glycosyltransferase [Oscillospiraceae bacterium]